MGTLIRDFDQASGYPLRVVEGDFTHTIIRDEIESIREAKAPGCLWDLSRTSSSLDPIQIEQFWHSVRHHYRSKVDVRAAVVATTSESQALIRTLDYAAKRNNVSIQLRPFGSYSSARQWLTARGQTMFTVYDHLRSMTALEPLLNLCPNWVFAGRCRFQDLDLFEGSFNSANIILASLSGNPFSAMLRISEIARLAQHGNVLVVAEQVNRTMLGELIAAGVKGVLIDGFEFDELPKAINTVGSGKRHFGISCIEVLGQEALHRLMNTDKELLSDNEMLVATLIAEGYSNKEIGHEIGKSTKTIDATRRRVMDKLDTQSVADITRYVIEMQRLRLLQS